MRERKQSPRADGTLQVRPTAAKTGPALNRDIQAKIGQQLRAAYDDIVDQGVPSRFVELLRNLDPGKAEGEKVDKDSTG